MNNHSVDNSHKECLSIMTEDCESQFTLKCSGFILKARQSNRKCCSEQRTVCVDRSDTKAAEAEVKHTALKTERCRFVVSSVGRSSKTTLNQVRS